MARSQGAHAQGVRLIKLLRRLQGRFEGTRLAELEQEFGVSRSQLRRDLLALEEAGTRLEIEQEQGRYGHGRVRLLDADTTAIPVTRSERYTLLAARGFFDIFRGSQLHDDMESIFEKVLQTMPAKTRKDTRSLQSKIFFRPSGGTKSYENHKDIIDPLLSGLLMERLPELVNTGALSVSDLARTVEALSAEEKQALVAGVLTNLDWGSMARIATLALRVINQIHDANPTFLAQRMAPGIKALVANLDFGEMEEAAIKARPEAEALADAFNDALWEYPAKFVCLGGLLPAFTNTLAGSVTRMISRANTMSPELITEVLLSLLKDVDGKAVGQLVNQFTELARKIHTGSALLGPPGLPEFTATLTQKLMEIGVEIDPNLLWKARQAMAEVAEARVKARTELLRARPDLLKARLAEQHKVRNAFIRARRVNVSLLDELDDPDLAEAVAEGAVKIDAQEVAETVNLWCAVLNRAREQRPDFVANMLFHFANSSDTGEIQRTVKWLADDLARALRPLARAVLPAVISTVAGWLSREDDESAGEVADCLAAWRNLLEE